MESEPVAPRRVRWMAVLRLVAICVALGIVGCSAQPARQEPSSPPATARYSLKGKIVSIDKAAKQVTVDHEEIPGLMGAMTMAYPVKDERVLDSLSPGDEVTATVVSGNGPYFLEEIVVAKRGATP